MLALARGATVAEAGRSSGFSRPTVYRRLADPEVLKEVRATRRRMFGATVGRLVKSSSRAADVLEELLSADGSEGEAIKLRAARTVLELGRAWLEIEDLEARMTALERAIAKRDERTNGRAIEHTRNGR